MYVVFKNIDEWFEKDPSLKKEFTNTYKIILRFVQENAISMNKMAEEKAEQSIKIEVSEQLLKQSLIDAYDDLFRLTNYHPTDTPNPIKNMAYIVYWMVRRKPIRLVTEDIVTSKKLTDMAKARFLFINEYIGVKLLVSAAFKGKIEKDVFKEENLQEIRAEAEKQLKYYQRFLLYYLVYRLQSPKELEAMVLGCTIYPIWEVDPVIWINAESLEQEF